VAWTRSPKQVEADVVTGFVLAPAPAARVPLRLGGPATRRLTGPSLAGPGPAPERGHGHSRGRLRAETDGGFSLIELLVVTVIIGVLVAIAVGVYMNYRQGAADKSAQSDVRGAISAVEHYYSDNDNKYPGASQVDQTSPIAIGSQTITLSDKTHLTLYVASATATSYKICAYNGDGSANRFYLYDSSVGGSVQTLTSSSFSMSTCS
jgi:type IV pilus assembly protein PilA